MRYKLFEEVLSISSNDIREQDEVRYRSRVMMKASGAFPI